MFLSAHPTPCRPPLIRHGCGCVLCFGCQHAVALLQRRSRNLLLICFLVALSVFFTVFDISSSALCSLSSLLPSAGVCLTAELFPAGVFAVWNERRFFVAVASRSRWSSCWRSSSSGSAHDDNSSSMLKSCCCRSADIFGVLKLTVV